MAKKFGKYSLLHRVAVGGMADIFVARHLGVQGFSRNIVIKKIRSHLCKEPSFVRMFLNEAKLAAQLNHSNICQIYDLGRIGESYFIAMEYVRGRDMRAVVSKTESKEIPFPLEYSLKVVAESCEGLFYAHRKTDDAGRELHIVHRDISPENIMVSFDGEVKILDFGIAKAENQATETKVGEIKGKLGYMSPEQVMGKALDHRSDLFSLGVVLYELVTGHKLFAGKSDVDVLRSVVDGRIYPPSYFRQEIPQQVEDLIMRALERNREQRYQSAWELQFDIQQFLSQHEFNPSNIHLSNFLRQIFAEEIRKDDAILARAEEEPVESAGEATASFAVDQTEGSEDEDDSARKSVAKKRQTTGKGKKSNSKKKKQTNSTKRRTTSKSHRKVDESSEGLGAKQENPDPLVAELLAEREGCLSVSVDVERVHYQRLLEIAERNGLTVPEVIREVLAGYTRLK